jgi:hypothetical protein
MAIIKHLSASLIAITMLAAPAMAHENFAAKHFIVMKGNPGAASDRWIYGHASASETSVHDVPGGVCDAGDNPRIC